MPDFSQLRMNRQRAQQQAAATKAQSELLHSQVDAAKTLSNGLTKIAEFLGKMNDAYPGSVDVQKLDEMQQQAKKNAELVETFEDAVSAIDDAIAVSDRITSTKGEVNGR